MGGLATLAPRLAVGLRPPALLQAGTSPLCLRAAAGLQCIKGMGSIMELRLRLRPPWGVPGLPQPLRRGPMAPARPSALPRVPKLQEVGESRAQACLPARAHVGRRCR